MSHPPLPAPPPAQVPTITVSRLDVAHWNVAVPPGETLLAAEVDWWCSAHCWAGAPAASALVGYIVPFRSFSLMVEGVRALGGRVKTEPYRYPHSTSGAQ